jgi:hypothetical protein
MSDAERSDREIVDQLATTLTEDERESLDELEGGIRLRGAPLSHVDGASGEIHDPNGNQLIHVRNPEGRRRLMDRNEWASTPSDWTPISYPHQRQG